MYTYFFLSRIAPKPRNFIHINLGQGKRATVASSPRISPPFQLSPLYASDRPTPFGSSVFGILFQNSSNTPATAPKPLVNFLPSLLSAPGRERSRGNHFIQSPPLHHRERVVCRRFGRGGEGGFCPVLGGRRL